MARARGVLSVIVCTALQGCSPDRVTHPVVTPGVTLSREAARGGDATVITAACDITGAVNEYRALLGTNNAGVIGEQPSGRREVNWDGVPAALTNTNDFPGDFFNQPIVGRARGSVYTTDGTGFRVSNNDFADVNPDYADEFNAFSPARTFAAVGSNELSVEFFVAGTTTPALSSGFGVIFSDVDRNGSAAIKLIAENGSSLGKYHAPPCPGGFSFVGVAFSSPVIAIVEITSGKGPLGADADDISDRDHGPARDLVIMDDFIYGEPHPR